VKTSLRRLGVATVCEEARCPNAGECWGCGTATFMILGEVCTRDCAFCAVTSRRRPAAPEPDEPARVAEAAAELDLRYVVLTSVDRDDLPDGGAAHFARTVEAVRDRCPGAVVEVLTPDFGADDDALAAVAASGAQVLAHNLETTRSVTPAVRDRRCDYDRSLAVLRAFRRLAPRRIVKSSLLLGLGETDDQIRESLSDLRDAGVDWVTMGQYLRPTRRHHPVDRYVPPEAFDHFADHARTLGFPLVTAGPLVRSSYKAGEEDVLELLNKRKT
jgi:lipoic acid synthetase